MKLNIGDKIKHLRREKDITQDELASILGVSYQSVSRRENNTCYPDMELLPTIADFFGVSVDDLLGIDKLTENTAVEAFVEEFKNAVSIGDIEKCIEISRNGISKYPNNYVLLNQLMYALFLSTDEDGNIPEWKENMKKYDAEITALGDRIIKYCPDLNIRLEATARLAFNHCEMGRKQLGRNVYETLPSSCYSKESQMWWGLNEDEKLPFARDAINKGFDMICSGIYNIVTDRLLSDDELLIICQKEFELINLIYDGNPPDNTWWRANDYFIAAELCARLGKHDEMISYLKQAVVCALKFDNRPDFTEACYVLLGNITYSKTDFETTDSRPLREIIRDKWLSSPVLILYAIVKNFRKSYLFSLDPPHYNKTSLITDSNKKTIRLSV